MDAIIEISGYVLGATVLFGAVVAAFLLRAYWYQPNPVVPHPEHLKLPTKAVDAIQQTLERVKRQQEAGSGAEAEKLSREVQRLEVRLNKLEQQTFDDHRDYQYAIKRREGVWLQWNELHDRAALLGKKPPADMRNRLKEVQRKYREFHRAVEEERHIAVAKDMMHLEELKGQEVLKRVDTEEVGMGAPSPAAEVSGSVPQAAPEAAPGTAPEAEGRTQPQESGLRLASFGDPQLVKSGKRYLDTYFELHGVGGILRDADLSGTDFENVEFRGAHIYQNCNFSHANLAQIRLERQPRTHQFAGCNFSGAHFIQSMLCYAVFYRCDLSRTHWAGARLDHVKFIDCRMDDVFWEQVDLSQTVMPADLAAQLDFSEASATPRTLAQPATAQPATAQPAGAGGEDQPIAGAHAPVNISPEE